MMANKASIVEIIEVGVPYLYQYSWSAGGARLGFRLILIFALLRTGLRLEKYYFGDVASFVAVEAGVGRIVNLAPAQLIALPDVMPLALAVGADYIRLFEVSIALSELPEAGN